MVARVADASILAAVIFDEPRADEALSLIIGSDLYEPTILSYELASVAKKKILLHPNHEHAIKIALRDALSCNMKLIDVDHMSVLDLALTTGLTTYDASYLFISRTLDIPLVTFDEQLKRTI